MAIVNFDSGNTEQMRPALLVENGWVDTSLAPTFKDQLKASRKLISSVIRCVGRVETDDASLPFIGTAFLIAPNLIVTTYHVAKGLRWDDLNSHEKNRAWINFNANPETDGDKRTQISRIVSATKVSQLALLELAESVDISIPAFSNKTPSELLKCPVGVIGYHANDMRNEKSLVEKMFGDKFNVKRVSPGQITDFEMSDSGDRVKHLIYDATTLGGSAGAPLIELSTGEIVGINYAGAYLTENYAIPVQGMIRMLPENIGQDIIKSSQLTSLPNNGVDPADSLERPVSAPKETKPPRTEIFNIIDLLKVNEDFVTAGLATNENLQAVFGMLPPEFVASLPAPPTATPGTKLLMRLQALNRYTEKFGNHLPFYGILGAAKQLCPFNFRDNFEAHLSVVKKFEDML